MNNKFLVGVITFLITISLIITCLNIFDSESKIDYSFERFFSKNKILIFQNRSEKINSDEYKISINSDNYIVGGDRKIIDNTNTLYKLYVETFNFEKEKNINIVLPSTANILFCNKEKVIYTNQFKLYEFSTESKKITKINLNNAKISSLKPLSITKSNFLCFAEVLKNNIYKTGFYIIDFKTGEIKLAKELETNNSSDAAKNSLRYSGKFSLFNEVGLISYCCDKFSKIYFFNTKGNFIKTITTEDNTPLPSVICNKADYTFYKRGSTWNTNMGLFIKGDKILVFSTVFKSINKMIIDEYSFNDNKYIQSYSFYYDGQTSLSLGLLYQKKNRLIISFENFFASFIF